MPSGVYFAMLCLLVLAAQGLQMGQDYPCEVVKVQDATHCTVKLTDSGKSIPISFAGVRNAPVASWAYQAGGDYMSKCFIRRDAAKLKVRVVAMPKSGPVQGELFVRDSQPPFSITDELLINGFVRLSGKNRAKARIQGEAKRRAFGIWTKKLGPIRVKESFVGGVVKVLSPTRFMVARNWNGNFNTNPWLRVRVHELIEPPKSSPIYADALTQAPMAKLEPYGFTGQLDFQGCETTFYVYSIDPDGTAVASIGYMTFSADTPDGMFRGEPHILAEDLLREGYARIDPKAKGVDFDLIRAQATAKYARKGIWRDTK